MSNGIILDQPGPIAIGVLVFLAIIMVVVAGFLVYQLLRTFRAVRSHFMPLGGKLAFWAAVVYTLSPIDILPDPMLIDDIGVMGVALFYINHLIQTRLPSDTGNESPPPGEFEEPEVS